MTKDAFEQGYAQRSGITVARLYEIGRYAVPCDCGQDDCKGWQMAHASDERMTEPTPAQRGVLDRYQDKRVRYKQR